MKPNKDWVEYNAELAGKLLADASGLKVKEFSTQEIADYFHYHSKPSWFFKDVDEWKECLCLAEDLNQIANAEEFIIQKVGVDKYINELGKITTPEENRYSSFTREWLRSMVTASALDRLTALLLALDVEVEETK